MNMDDMILISVDDHVVEPPDVFDNHLAAKYKDRAPSSVSKKNGAEMRSFGERQHPNIG